MSEKELVKCIDALERKVEDLQKLVMDLAGVAAEDETDRPAIYKTQGVGE